MLSKVVRRSALHVPKRSRIRIPRVSIPLRNAHGHIFSETEFKEVTTRKQPETPNHAELKQKALDTSLATAVEKGFPKMAEELLKNGADSMARCSYYTNNSILYEEAAHGSKQMFDLLHKYTKNPNNAAIIEFVLKKNENSYAFVWTVARCKHILDKGFNPFGFDRIGAALMLLACRVGDLDLIKMLFNSGLAVHNYYVTEYVTTAIESGQYHVTMYLIRDKKLLLHPGINLTSVLEAATRSNKEDILVECLKYIKTTKTDV